MFKIRMTDDYRYFAIIYLLTDETDGRLSSAQTFSSRSLFRISQAKIDGLSRLSCKILFTTFGVATFGFDPPITPGIIDPVA